MSVHKSDDMRKVTTHRLSEMKQRGEKISMLTAYDFSMATILDQAGVDVLLVGDSASNVMCGNTTTLPITLDEMIFMAKSVAKAVVYYGVFGHGARALRYPDCRYYLGSNCRLDWG